MTLFDYDARPVTPQVVLIADRSSRTAYEIRDFLTRNGRPYEFRDAEMPAGVDALSSPVALDAAEFPICILPDGTRLARATVERVAAALGMITPPQLEHYDLAIVGAGPAGLGAAVNASSEGLATAVIEGVAPGGQAGTTSLIENYLGFPTGISGSELATRAAAQARRFGAEILLARRLARLSVDGVGFVSGLSDGTVIRSRAVLMASGVEWRRLDVPGVDDLLGAGVYYGAGPSEALACRGSGVVIVGAGNSAGQAAVRFSKYARQVTLLCRGERLGASMSQYLVDALATIDNVEVRTSTHVTHIDADGGMRRIVVRTSGEGSVIPADALFICIGGTPRSEGAAAAGAATDAVGYVLTGGDVQFNGARVTRWPLPREPLPLETSIPGLFAAGDVRHGSIKRCAAAIGEGGMAVALVHRHLAGANDG
jgi:thioredoxin reductase (NADPH)